ncbi:hypothetical protein, partial [Treponema saccharophilum]|uniref:hypothetical protein n=1 Tax=Treponema saccharophilum TaxID=165 RepID=UPI0038642DBB
MVYGVLNFVLAGLLMWLSYFVDRKIENKAINNPIVVMNSWLAFACVAMGIAVISSLSMAPERMTTFMGKCMYL